MTHPTDALRLVPHEKVRELAMQLARSIAGLGYPVGLGVAPPEDVCMKAAQGIFDLYLTAAPASPLPGVGQLSKNLGELKSHDLDALEKLDRLSSASAKAINLAMSGRATRAAIRDILSEPTDDARAFLARKKGEG